MATLDDLMTEPRILAAVDELKHLVRERYPGAEFDVFPSTNVNGIYMRIFVDIDDPGDVNEAILDRVVEMQIDGGLPIYPVAVRPIGMFWEAHVADGAVNTADSPAG